MAKNVKDSMADTFGTLAAIETIAVSFPAIVSIDALTAMNTLSSTFEFLFKLLEMCGVTHSELMDEISRWLSGKAIFDYEKKAQKLASEGAQKATEKPSNNKASEGMLDAIEYTLKTILLANLKDAFGGCPIDPIIPDHLMINVSSRTQIAEPIGIEIPLDNIDLFGILKQVPTDENGSIYYFDAHPTIYTDSHNYTPNELWKSMDFNAYLWYVINKGNISVDKFKNTWDNRTRFLKDFITLKSNDVEPFFNANCGIYGENLTKNGNILTKINGETYAKEQICICEYEESSKNNSSNVIHFWINADKYKATIKDKHGAEIFKINKTIFEFNYDYIMSIKLFDSKTIVSNILNAMFSLTNAATFQTPLSVNLLMVQEKVRKIVDNVIMEISDENSDLQNNCSFSFSNKDYDEILNKVREKNILQQRGSEEIINYDKIISGLQNIDNSLNQAESIKEVLEISSEEYQNRLSFSANISYDLNFFKEFITQCVSQIIMQLMTPKLAMLFAVNSAVMGDITDVTGWKSNFEFTFSSMDNFFETYGNIMTSLCREVVKMIIQFLYNFLISKLKEWLSIFSAKLLYETYYDYVHLITQLIENCAFIPKIPFPNNENLLIGDAIADIVPTQNKPNQKDC